MSVRRYRINSPTAIHDTIDGEVVIINFDTGTYYSLEGAGAYVWSLVEAQATTDEMLDYVSQLDRNNGPAMASRLEQFLTELEDEGLLVGAPADEPRGNLSTDVQVPRLLQRDGLEPDAFRIQKFTDMNQLLLLDPIHEVDQTGWPHLPAEAQAAESTGHAS
jgi:Coenzyme PQQ synthesis protein D (PqqD)